MAGAKDARDLRRRTNLRGLRLNPTKPAPQVLFGLFYFAIWGRKQYYGPIVEVDDRAMPASRRDW